MSEALHTVLGADLIVAGAAAFLRANLGMAAGIITVVALRGPLRRTQGASAAYGLWLAPLTLALLAVVSGLLRATPEPLSLMLGRHPDLLHGALLAWAAGVVVLATAFSLAQARFQAELKAGHAGPAVVGFFSPRIVFPTNDGAYTASERELIRAHEREHVARKDPRAVAIATLVRCICWPNPLVHLAAGLMRLDQELACDAAVILRRPAARGLYARTLLKGQMAARPGPLACSWLALGVHPLEVRVAQLKRPGVGSSAGVVHPARDAIRP